MVFRLFLNNCMIKRTFVNTTRTMIGSQNLSAAEKIEIGKRAAACAAVDEFVKVVLSLNDIILIKLS